MCGITGWIHWEQDLSQHRDILEKMVQTLAARGPDDAGIWAAQHAALGHRRLSVIDIVGGKQPMVRKRGSHTYVITYNGELYNAPELRRDLIAKGHRFEGHSDTEVLLASYIEWGPACTEKLNGIFAFGIWDNAAQNLFLARDPLGIKPLFYTEQPRQLIFGSEIKALLAHPNVPAQVSADGLAEIFVIGPGRTPGHGIFHGITELRPGHWLLYDRQGLKTHCYWSLKSKPHPDDFATTTATIRELLQDAVIRQLVADVPICSLLSGGLDSSAVTAFSQDFLQKQGQCLLTYSVDYVGNDRNFRPNRFQPNADAPWVKQVSRYLGTQHHNIVIDTAELVNALHVALRGRDIPGMVDVDASLYLFCREVKKGATVALSGEAADEIFGGYPWFHTPEAIAATTFPWIRMVKERSRILSPELCEMIQPEKYVAQRYQEALDEVPRLPGEDPAEARLREISYLNITRFMPILLDRMDRMSMAVGLEVRVPYCDHRLVEYVWNIPWKMKNSGGRAKGVLRDALDGLLPQEVLLRQKSPYPKTHNPDYMQEMRDQCAQILQDPASPLLPLVDSEVLSQIIRSDAAAYNPAWFSQLMGGPQLFAYLWQINTWLREYHIQIV